MSLELHECEFALAASEFRLPALTSLTLRNSDAEAGASEEWDTFIRGAHLPSLTHLALTDDLRSAPATADPSRTAALKHLAPRLTSFELDDAPSWITADDPTLWPRFSSLQHLRIREPPARNDEEPDEIGHLLVSMLHTLPRSLKTLNLATRHGQGFSTTAWNACFALRERLTSVRALRRLVLPDVDRWTGVAEEVARSARGACEVLEAEARARGVLVEYVDLDDL